ncbi:MFS transporter [Clostridium sp. PL3]|uniref:MFS transporter n=1 Tax=Clostridium thailandense TaxID=2794346 RepID=A0A949X3L0_9CLOT|nr:glycoside-pentoside-hexuronide (GPH):cation symporter [Clostridium thailandense]MBV7272568.1 MFS transporter [Clostridium thailandense]
MENVNVTEKPLKKSIINLYGLPSLGFQLLINMELFYLAAFLTDSIKVSVAISGTVLMLTSIADVIWVPTSGVVLEKTNFRWGKYRSWLLIGPPITVLFYILEFSKIGSPSTAVIIICIGFIVSHLTSNTSYAAHLSMNSAMTTVREERIAMSSNRGLFNAIGSIVFSAVSMPLILALGKNNQVMGYTLTVVIAGIALIALYYIFFFMTKDYAHSGTSNESNKAEEKLSAGDMIRQIILNPPLIGLMLAEFGRYLGRFVIFGMAFYYFKYVVSNLAVVTIFFTGLSVVCLVGAAIASPIAKKIGERNTYILSLLIFICCLLAVWALPMNYISFMILMFIAYFGYAMPDALGVALYSNTVEYGEWKTGKNARGFIMSLLAFPIKIAVFARSVIITAVLMGAGYVANMKPTAQLIKGVTNGITLIPAVFMVFGLIFIILLYKITPKSLEKMQREIKERKGDTA